MISIIVPIYRTEIYLRKCIDSLVNQIFKDIEIILVDDGSNDNCGMICDEYAAIDSRIQVVHQKNMGLSSSRNVGIDKSNGEYITFVDGDDFLDEDAVLYMNNNLKDNQDVLLYRDRITDINGNTVEECKKPSGLVFYGDEKTFLDEVIVKMHNSVCDKVYKKEVIGNRRFPIGKVHGEDYLFNLEIAKSIKSVVYVDEVKYNTVVNKDSITRKGFNKSTFDQIYIKKNVQELIDKKFPDYIKYGNKQLFLTELHVFRTVYYAGVEKEYSDRIKEIREELTRNYKNVSFDLNLIEKIEYFIFCYCNNLYYVFLLALNIVKGN